MNDAEYEAQTKRVEALQAKWKERLGLSNWAVTHTLHREAPNDPKSQWAAMASVDVHWEYEIAAIDWYAPEMVDESDRSLEGAFLHEMAHLLVEELRQAPPVDRGRHLERVCTRIGWALLWTDEAIRAEEKKDVPCDSP